MLTIGDETNMSGISMNSKDRFKSVSGMPQSGGLVVQGSQASTCKGREKLNWNVSYGNECLLKVSKGSDRITTKGPGEERKS